MSRRHYVNNAPQRTLASGITSGATSCTIASTFSGWPILFPFYATLDLGQLSEEIVLVTNIVGAVATITRAQDGSAAVSHTAGATLDFTVGAADFDEANAHVNSATGVHSISGSVVGTSDSQTLTNKTLTNPTVNAANVSGTWAGTIAASGLTLTSPNLTTPSITKGTHTGDATTAAITAQAGPTNTQIVNLKDNTGVSVGTIDAAAGITVGRVTSVLVPKTYATEALATAGGANIVGATVWLTAPTTGPVGPFTWNGTSWLPDALAGQRLQATQTTGLGQSLTNGAFTTITGFAIDKDTFGAASFVIATGVWTCPAAGDYEICGQVTATGGTAVRLIVGIAKNGGVIYSSYQSGAPNTHATAVLPPKEFTLAASDTITLQGDPNAAGVVTTTQNGNASYLRIKRVG